MDQKAGDNGRLTALERIKADHEMLRQRILANDEDEFDLDVTVQPQQIGLQLVWADENGSLWVMRYDDKGQLKLKRLWQHG